MNDADNNDNVNLIKQKIEAFKTRNTSNGVADHESLFDKLQSNVVRNKDNDQN